MPGIAKGFQFGNTSHSKRVLQYGHFSISTQENCPRNLVNANAMLTPSTYSSEPWKVNGLPITNYLSLVTTPPLVRHSQGIKLAARIATR